VLDTFDGCVVVLELEGGLFVRSAQLFFGGGDDIRNMSGSLVTAKVRAK
jgi:hypothetical protein